MTPKRLAEAWTKYVKLFGEPPHGTEKQLAALLEFVVAPPEKEPGLRCPKCGAGGLELHLEEGVVYCNVIHEDGLHYHFYVRTVEDFAQFFPPSPQERWVPDAETLAKKMQDLASWLYRKDQYVAWAKLALEALAAPPAQPSPQASDKERCGKIGHVSHKGRCITCEANEIARQVGEGGGYKP